MSETLLVIVLITLDLAVGVFAVMLLIDMAHSRRQIDDLEDRVRRLEHLAKGMSTN